MRLRIADLTKKIERLETKLQEKQNEYEILRNDFERLETKLQEKQDECKKLQSDLDVLVKQKGLIF